MTRYIIRRILQSIPLLLIVSLILFVTAQQHWRSPRDDGRPKPHPSR
jgi:ABC-type dipeptide/oligopeptide/nickel transport system permease component